MKVLVLNCGSSSLKYRLLQFPGEKEIAGGEAQRVGPPTAEPARIYHSVAGGAPQEHFVEMPSHGAAFAEVMKLLDADGCAATRWATAWRTAETCFPHRRGWMMPPLNESNR